jgi:hypothetical protein
MLDRKMGFRWVRRQKGGRVFFFLKKKEAKKTLFTGTYARQSASVPVDRSFLVLFFKKERV